MCTAHATTQACVLIAKGILLRDRLGALMFHVFLFWGIFSPARFMNPFVGASEGSCTIIVTASLGVCAIARPASTYQSIMLSLASASANEMLLSE
jgi:hypothetical protein